MSKNHFDHFKHDYHAMTGAMARLGMERKAEAGIYPHRLPIGYMRTFHDGIERIEFDPKTFALVQRAFKRATSRRSSLSKVLAELQESGMKGYSGSPITRSALHRLLQNRLYLGEMNYKNKVLVGRHPALVSHSTYSQVQASLRARRRRAEPIPQAAS